MWTPAHEYLHTNTFVHTENVFRTPLQNAGKRSRLSATASSGTPALSLFNTEQRRPALAAFSNHNAVFFLDQSTQHVRYRASLNHFQKASFTIWYSHVYVACLTATIVLFPFYRSRPIESASCRPPKLMTFRSPFYISFGCSQFKNFSLPDYRDNQCDESLLHAIRTIYILCTATYWSYVKRDALYRTFISQSFVRGHNSNDPVAGRVSGVVVDEGGHAVCLPFVT